MIQTHNSDYYLQQLVHTLLKIKPLELGTSIDLIFVYCIQLRLVKNLLRRSEIISVRFVMIIGLKSSVKFLLMLNLIKIKSEDTIWITPGARAIKLIKAYF